MGGRFTRDLSNLFLVLLASACAGAMIGVSRTQGDRILEDALSGSLTGVVIGLGGTLAEFFVFSNANQRFVRKLPVVLIMIARALYYSLFIILGLAVPDLISGGSLPWLDPTFGEVFLISACVALGFSIAIEIMRQLGAEATLALFTGRYTRPRLEDRVILFADLVRSTSLAERIGDLQFHAFLQEVALDLAGAIEHAKGRVHRYVGDAVIVSWPLQKGVNGAVCLDCAVAMHKILEDRAPYYFEQFGQVAELRVAVHCGQVAAGEIGDWKKEIALLGDAMNTAARIEGAVRVLGVTTALSNDVVQHFPETKRSGLRRLPDYKAHGKRAPLSLWTPGLQSPSAENPVQGNEKSL